MDFFAKIRCQHGFHNRPDFPKPTGRIDNEKHSHTDWDTSLQHHHEIMAITEPKVVHVPVVHVGNKSNSFGAQLFLFAHSLHAIDQIVNNLLGRCLGRKVSARAHIKHVVSFASFQAWSWKQSLTQKLLFHLLGREIQITTIILFHDLPRSMEIEFIFSRTATSKTKDHFIRKGLIRVFFVPLFLQVIKAFLFLRIQRFDLFHDGFLTRARKSHRARAQFFFQSFKVQHDGCCFSKRCGRCTSSGGKKQSHE
mmetsp:Transcript_29427/g.44903  ORF Transcript_29427/g.44903 Transcript_29427/m.44903 type:complete len:252 (-) Transcript_29427:4-759(-)